MKFLLIGKPAKPEHYLLQNTMTKTHYTSIPPEIVGMFIDNTTDLNHHKAEEPYWITSLPMPFANILSLFNEFIDHERYQSSIALPRSVVICANLTGKRVNVVNENGFFKSYAPLKLDILGDLQAASSGGEKFFIMSLHTIKSTQKDYQADRFIDYVKQLRDHSANRIDRQSLEMKKVYEYILSCYESKKFTAAFNAGDTCNVAVMHVINMDFIMNVVSRDAHFVYILSKKIKLWFA